MLSSDADFNVLKVFQNILAKYMQAYGLEAIDIAFLTKSTRKNIQSVLDLKGSLELERLEAIAQIFGQHYYEFGNPEHPMPPKNALPTSTLNRIQFRNAAGPHTPTSYKSLDILEKLTIILSKYKVNDEFLAEDIVKSINMTYGEQIDTTIAGGRLASAFKGYVEKTDKQDMDRIGRGPKPYYYKIVKQIPSDKVLQAQETVRNYK